MTQHEARKKSGFYLDLTAYWEEGGRFRPVVKPGKCTHQDKAYRHLCGNPWGRLIGFVPVPRKRLLAVDRRVKARLRDRPPKGVIGRRGEAFMLESEKALRAFKAAWRRAVEEALDEG